MTNKDFREQVHTLIPGGAHTYSKGDDQFPDNAPAAIAYGKGAWIWDIEGVKFLDCSMGLTSVSLGHAYEPVLESVKEELDKGVNFQRPSYIELELAKKFLELIPQHQMVKFAKNGSTVTTAAVKLARAHTGRKLIAFPSDHPFYSYDDWFIGSTLCNKGVPEEIEKLSVTFQSCNLQSLDELFKKYPGQIAAVITEPEKPHCGVNCSCSIPPSKFLTEAIKLTRKEGALFILDEMVTGFKTDLPGSMSKWNLDVDMATWGKGIANGFSFCALTGKREIMELGGIQREGEEKVFLISTTHGAETHSLRAGIKTIEIFRSKKVIDHIRSVAITIKDKCTQLVKEYSLTETIEVQGHDWIIGFVFKNQQKQIDASYRTLFMQEMIKKGILFQGVFVPCLSHGEVELNLFFQGFEHALKIYQKALATSVNEFLVGKPSKPVFRKYL
jgi:glutamate-1-semialdehyde aminotransferase